jgi:excisionase family DNA binding protein
MKELLTEQEAAEYLGMHTNTLLKMRKPGINKRPLPYVRINGKTIRYRKSEIDKFLEEHTLK